MKIKFLAVMILFFACSTLRAQPIPYKDRVEIIYNNINKELYNPSKGLFYETTAIKPDEKPHSFLWPLCAMIQAANEAEVLNPSISYMEPVLKAIEQYYNTNPPTPGYQAYVTAEEKSDRYYDDNQWVAIACLDAYNRTKKQRYLDLSEEIYRFMMTGFDQRAGGGLYWKEGDNTTKNTCSNGPGILVALQLYKVTKENKYLDTALLLYDWTNKYLLAPEGVYYDAVKLPSMKIDSARYTYNTGTMLQSNVLLYEITKDEKYLREAKRIAKAAEKYFYKNNRLPGHYWFNAVLLRGYVELFNVDKNKQQLQFFIDDANRIWQQEKDEQNLLGRQKRKTLIDQAAMMEIYARLAVFEQ